MTGVVMILSAGEAQRLTQRIKLTASSVRDGMFKLRNLVEEAKQSNVWQVLGFPSWTAYLADTLADEPMRLGREERQELVGYLAGEGLSTRAIAPIVGVSREQVRLDVAGDKKLSPAPAETPGSADEPAASFETAAVRPEDQEDIDAAEVAAIRWNDPEPAPKPITGLDGKQYTRPEPQAPRRRSIVDDAYTANNALWKAVEGIRAITRDDRFTKNKADIRAALQPSVDLAMEVLADLVNTRTEN